MIKFFDRKSGREIMVRDWGGEPWLFYRHPDGQWVSLRKAKEEETVWEHWNKEPHQYYYSIEE